MPVYIVAVEIVQVQYKGYYYYRILEVIEGDLFSYGEGKYQTMLSTYYGTSMNVQMLIFEREPDNPLRRWRDK